MRTVSLSVTDRRGFLRLGVLAGLASLTGCGDGGGEPGTIATPPAPGGNRSRIEGIKDKSDDAPVKKKK